MIDLISTKPRYRLLPEVRVRLPVRVSRRQLQGPEQPEDALQEEARHEIQDPHLEAGGLLQAHDGGRAGLPRVHLANHIDL